MSKRRRGGGRGSGVAATAIAPAPMVREDLLEREFFGALVPKSENYRTHYGKLLDLQTIDWALRQAEQGSMMSLTDIMRETNQLDGHLSSVLQKRLNRLAALDHQITAATGPRVNPQKADLYASYVRDQIDGTVGFRDTITQLAWGIFDGRAAGEHAWRWLDGDYALLGVHWIHPRRLSFGPYRDIRVIDTALGSSGGFRDVGFPIEQIPYKFITYRPQLFNDYPEREGLGPRCLYWSRFGRFGVHERNLLLELFGRPWRVIKPMLNATTGAPLNGNIEAARNASEVVKALGYNTVARLPPGFDVDIHQPYSGAGQISSDVIDHSMKVLSKLVLGNTGTTDAVSTGLGSTIGNAHVSEEDLIIWSDARRLGEAIQIQIINAIIAVNFGPDEIDNAPKFTFRTESPMTVEEEGNRIDKALAAGLPVSLEQARERLGIREVKPGEPYIIRVQRPAAGFGQLAPPPSNEVVYPIGKAPEPGELPAAPLTSDGLPSDAAPPGSAGPGPGGRGNPAPPALPAAPSTPASSGGQPPDVDEPDAVAALCEQMNEYQVRACEHGRVNMCEWCGIERERELEMVGGEPQWIVKWKPLRKPSAASPLPSA